MQLPALGQRARAAQMAAADSSAPSVKRAGWGRERLREKEAPNAAAARSEHCCWSCRLPECLAPDSPHRPCPSRRCADGACQGTPGKRHQELGQ